MPSTVILEVCAWGSPIVSAGPWLSLHLDDDAAVKVVAECAHERGWQVHLYRARDVEAQAARILGERAGEVLGRPRAALGPPWTKDHRIALAATIVVR